MSANERLEQLRLISQIAASAGMKGMIDEDGQHFAMGFDLGEGRSQTIYIHPTKVTPENKQVVTFMSPCLVVRKGFMSGLSKDQALELLLMNQNIPFARFGIMEFDSENLVVASVDHLLETLDPDELRNSAYCVAMAADSYEQHYGKDDF
jgi:hypothetical protein